MIAWIVGSKGLLGAALARNLKEKKITLFTPTFSWNQETLAKKEMEQAFADFVIKAKITGQWQIYWAAGTGSMASNDAELSQETRTLTHFLHCLQNFTDLLSTQGSFAFASSAGAIYAGAKEDCINENTPDSPTTAYAREKIKQEALVRALAKHKISILIARISTIYGPGQAFGKKQGLIAHIARCILRNKPIQIYVPLDTIRDYISVSDAANMMIQNLFMIQGSTKTLLKIIASEQATTIAEIIGTFKRLTRRAPKVITSVSSSTQLYQRKVQFQSIHENTLAVNEKTTLTVGIAQVMASERLLLAQSLD